MNKLIRNAVFTEFGSIDCEVNHPEFGWIPYNIPSEGGVETLAMHYLASQQAAPYSKDPEAELELARKRKIVEINDVYTAAVIPLIRDYPEIEQSTWWAQEGEARAYLTWFESQQGDPPATPVLDNILAGRNGEDGTETLEELSQAVMENAAMFTQAQQLTGKRQRLVKLARNASAEALETINW